MLFAHESGILLHPTSLPGRFGIGEIGPEALRFLDLLRAAGQRLWQVLPLGPTGYGDSPYQGLSTFAANPLVISLEALWDDGLLGRDDLASFPRLASDSIHFEMALPTRWQLLRKAASTFVREASAPQRNAFETFAREQSAWLDDYAMFVIAKEQHGGRSWIHWPAGLRDRKPEALVELATSHAAAILETKVLQYLWSCQWSRVRRAARELGIRIIGDVPIFVAHDSADVWVHRDLFQLDQTGRPMVIVGVPPDYFSATGQRWGNPLYDWPRHEAEGFGWWIRRLQTALATVDVLRIDHFRGLAAYWEIPVEQPTAVNGRWVPAAGAALLTKVREVLGHPADLPFIAEDLGVITEDVVALRERFGLPGLRILQFAFGNDPQRHHFEPRNYVPNCVAYTGTHDNDTIMGWFQAQAGENDTRSTSDIERERATVRAFFQVQDGHNLHRRFIECLLSSAAGAVLFPMQDVLGLGSSARMNVPGRPEGNWRFRLRWDQVTTPVLDWLASATVGAGRSLHPAGR